MLILRALGVDPEHLTLSVDNYHDDYHDELCRGRNAKILMLMLDRSMPHK